MKRILIAAVGLVTLGAPVPAAAGIYTDDLTRCLVAATSTEDRVAFARWMFTAMSAGEAVSDLTTVTDAQRTEGNRRAAHLLQRLILTDCRPQAVLALKYEGGDALVSSFEMVGRVAIGDLMRDPGVAAQLDSLDTYIDQDAMAAFGREAAQ